MRPRHRRIAERVLEGLIRFSGVLSIIVAGLIMLFLLGDALPALQSSTLGELLLGRTWRPTAAEPEFGFLPLALGSLLVTAVAIALAVPMGVGCAVFISEVMSPRFREAAKPAIELLAAIPSVVFGFIGLEVVGAWLKGATGFASSHVAGPDWLKGALNMPTPLAAITGSVVLAFMALPTIVSIAEDALRAVPSSYRNASLAMGATKWQTIRRVTLPAARQGIVAAVMLGIGRTVGETMTVLMVTGNAAVIPALDKGLFRPVRTMTATIAAEMGETAYRTPHYHVLFMLGLCLLLITFAVNTAADVIVNRTKHVERR